MKQEVRFDRMVPTQIVARRTACNLAYLPVGCLEWHGAHMPFGTDYITVTHIAEQSARRHGGIVFPPIYYNDVRYQLHDRRVEWKNTYCRSLQIPEVFAQAFPLDCSQAGADAWPTVPDDGPEPADKLEFSHDEQCRAFARHIARVLTEIHLYGFRHILLLPGHGPNPQYCKTAEEIYRANIRRRSSFGPPARTLTYSYFGAVSQVEPMMGKIWLHADKWEGSVTMAAAPATVHLELLPTDPQAIPPAYLGHPYLTEDGYTPATPELQQALDYFDPRHGTGAAYGRKQIRAVLKDLRGVIRQFMTESGKGTP